MTNAYANNRRNNKRKYFTAITMILISMLALFALCSCHDGSQNSEESLEPKEIPAVSEEAVTIAETTSEAISMEDPDKDPAKETVKPTPAAGQPQQLTCTVTITCKTILSNMKALAPGKEEVVPPGGIIMSPETVVFEQGDSVFDALVSATKARKIHMEFTTTPVYKSAYIEGINNIYEFDCGELSGWMYKVNGEFPSRGCSTYELTDGDAIEWIYSCSLGSDIGGNYLEQKGD